MCAPSVQGFPQLCVHERVRKNIPTLCSKRTKKGEKGARTPPNVYRVE